MPTSPVLGFTYPTPLDPATADLWGATLNTLLLVLDSEAGTKTVDLDFAGFKAKTSELIDTQETTNSLGNISGAVAVDYTNGHYQYGTVTGNITSLTISNWPASGKTGWLTLELTQDGTGGRTIALTSAYKTIAGGGVTLSTAASARDLLRFETRDGGTTIDTFVNLDMQ